MPSRLTSHTPAHAAHAPTHTSFFLTVSLSYTIHIFGLKSMARLSSISLLFLFLFNLLGGISLLLIQRNKRHEAVEAMIASEAFGHRLTHLHITAELQNEINWVEPEREFRYKGEMYDVVKMTPQEDGSIIYQCIEDKEETHLYSQMVKQLDGTPIGQDNDMGIVIAFFKFLDNYFDTALKPNTVDHYVHLKIGDAYVTSNDDIALPLPSEPPEMI